MTALSKLEIFSPAKINLFLHITGKRTDGYHDLQTVFRLLDWGDCLNFEISHRTFDPCRPISDLNFPISLSSNVVVTAALTDNLISKAAITLINEIYNSSLILNMSLPERLPIIDIALQKVLPTGAGLGGGSSNAATTLLALNKLWDLNLTTDTLIDIGTKVGADVPVFILGQDAIAEGIGNRLTPIDLPHQHYLILNPHAHASTQSLFAHPHLCRDTPSLSLMEIKDATENYLTVLNAPFHNVFEPVVAKIVPEVAEALDYLNILKPVIGTTARMTGSGSSVFLPIPTDKLDTIKNYIKNIKIPPCHALLTQSLTKK